jgi:hypothetical protein
MARRTGVVAVLAIMGALAVGVLAAIGSADDGPSGQARTELSTYMEVPSLSTTATGQFRARIESNPTRIEYSLTYSGLEGGQVSQAHIHFAQAGVNGGISAWLCEGTLASPTDATPACPASGTVTGTITAAEVIGPTGQGIPATAINELLAAMRAGFTYANVHTVPSFPGGELRGQIKAGGDDDD